jgi:PAS domain-containing protein
VNTQKTKTTWPELTAILLARLGALWLIVFISLLLPTDDIAFYAFMGIAFTVTIPYSLWLRSKIRRSQFAPLQFMVDLTMVTGLVYFSGGIHSEFTLLYPLVILSAGIVGNPKQAAVITVLAVSMYGLLAGMLANNILVAYVPDKTPLDMEAGSASIVLRSLAFAVFGGASVYIAKRCDYIEAQERVLVNTTYALLENIPVPALLLSDQGKILAANEPASYKLNISRQDLCSRSFADLRREPSQPIPESFGHSAALLREKSTPLPVAYRTRDFQISESALYGSRHAVKETIIVTLLVFNDISEELRVRRQLDKVERITNATRIAGEMAHEIQGPLASLSASLQLLKHYEAKATAADWLPNSPRRQDRIELFNHIEDASTRIDTSIKNFVDFAEFSPQDLLSIIKLDSIGEKQGYIDHLNSIGRDQTDGQNSYSG